MPFKLCVILLLLQFGALAQGEPKVEFSVIGGVYEEEWLVELNSGPESTIYYTLDGTVPNSGSKKYSTPIQTDSITIIRAVAYSDGKRSEVVTQSYFSNRSYTLPVISIVTDPANFWDFSTGIYVKGCCADSVPPYYGANFWKSWEKPCNIEMYTSEGKLCFNQRAGVRIFGGFSKMLPQKSLAIIARSKYGSNRFDYRIFKERKTKSYKSFILRNSGGDFMRTQLRDAYMTQMARPTGIAIQAYEPAVVFINGRYWGVLNLREKLNEHYLKANFGVDKDNVDLLKHHAGRQHGYSTEYKRLLSYLKRYDLTEDKWVDSLSKFMDIQDFITYNICEVYSQNQDAGGNIRYFKERKPGAKWRWILFDMDLGLGNTGKAAYKENTLHKFTTLSGEIWPNPGWSTLIIRSLLKNKDLEAQYVNTFCDHLNTIFHPDSAVGLLERMANRIAPEMPFHQKRWGSSMTTWYTNIERVKTFVKERPAYLKQHLQEKFELSDPVNIRVVVPEGNICKIKVNTLTLKQSFNGQYYREVPIHVSIDIKHDYELVGWKDRSEKSGKFEVNPTEGLVLEPIIMAKPFSMYKDSILINEVSFIQAEADSSDDWIELHNRSSETLNLSGWSITKSKYKKGYKFPEINLKPGGFVVVSRNKVNLNKYYNVQASFLIGDMDFGFSKKGERLKLYDSKGLIVDEVKFKSMQTKLDSAISYALIHPDSSRNETVNWSMQTPTPLTLNVSHVQILEAVKAAEKRKRNIMISAGGGTVLLLLGFFVLRRKRHKRTQVSPGELHT